MTTALLLSACIDAGAACSKTVAESDVMLFAGITGDFSDNHVNEDIMHKSSNGGRIAHGAPLLGYMSRASTLIFEKCAGLAKTHRLVSAGYDRVRFLHAIRIGDTVTAHYRIVSVSAERMRTLASIELTNQNGEI